MTTENPKDRLHRNLAGKVRSRELLGGELDPQEKHIRALLREKLANFPGVIGFAIVGSRALCYALPESDFDALILTDRQHNRIAPILDLQNLNKDAQKTLGVTAEVRLLNMAPTMGPCPITIDDQKIELWFRNISLSYLLDSLNSKKYDNLALAYQALFNPNTTVLSRKIRTYRVNAARQFQAAFPEYGARMEAINSICHRIAVLETYSIRPKKSDDGLLSRLEESKFNIRTKITMGDAQGIQTDRANLWYRHLSKYLLGHSQTNALPEPPEIKFERIFSAKILSRRRANGRHDTETRTTLASLKNNLAAEYPNEFVGLAIAGPRGLGYSSERSDFDLLVMLNCESSEFSAIADSVRSQIEKMQSINPTIVNVNIRHIERLIQDRNVDDMPAILMALYRPGVSTPGEASVNVIRSQFAKNFMREFEDRKTEEQGFLRKLCQKIANREMDMIAIERAHEEVDFAKANELYSLRAKLWLRYLSKQIHTAAGIRPEGNLRK